MKVRRPYPSRKIYRFSNSISSIWLVFGMVEGIVVDMNNEPPKVALSLCQVGGARDKAQVVLQGL